MKEDQKITFFEITGEKQLKTRLTSWSPKPNLEGTLVGLKIGRVNENDEDQYFLAGNILNGKCYGYGATNILIYDAAAKQRTVPFGEGYFRFREDGTFEISEIKSQGKDIQHYGPFSEAFDQIEKILLTLEGVREVKWIES